MPFYLEESMTCDVCGRGLSSVYMRIEGVEGKRFCISNKSLLEVNKMSKETITREQLDRPLEEIMEFVKQKHLCILYYAIRNLKSDFAKVEVMQTCVPETFLN